MSQPADSVSHIRSGKTARNIDAILRLEKDSQSELSAAHRFFHKVGWFVGTVYFSIFQCLGLLIWIGLNAGPSSFRHPFDPYPFPLLSALLSLEAVFLTSFVLIRQTATDMQAERRNHLDLQINMLAEEEATAIRNYCAYSLGGWMSTTTFLPGTDIRSLQWRASRVI